MEVKTSSYSFDFELYGDHAVLIKAKERRKNEICWIPESVKGVPVTEIASNSFVDATFRRLAFPEGLKVIRESAFVNCNNLQKLEFPFSLERLEKNSFWKCQNLTSAEFCVHIQCVQENAFNGCKIEEIKIPRMKKQDKKRIFEDLSILEKVY
ncbi:MAG: leucine-rich repeat domain-containing protein [Ruminococcus sp.]